MSRRYLIIVSVAAHVAVGLGLFIAGVWKIERLDYRHRVSLSLGAMMPPGEMGGGEGDKDDAKAPEKQKQKKEPKREKTKVDLRQVEKVEKADDKPVEVALEATGGGGGIGDGEGPGVGPGTGGGGGGTCDPLTDANQCQDPIATHTPACGDRIVDGGEQCDDGNTTSGDKCSATCKIEQVLIPPGIFTGMRIAGETQIVPPDPVKTEMLRAGKERTVGSFKLCIDASGRTSSIAPIGGGTKYPAYDAKITAAMRGWRYRPYTISSQGTVSAVPACSVVTFVYTIK